MADRQYVIIGAGNMGCVYGGNLARVGRNVALLDVWKEHIEAIREQGLRMEGLHGEFTARVEAFADPNEAPKADVAVILVSAYATAAAAETCRIVLKDSGFALTLQNGLGNVEVLADALGAERVLAGLSFHSGDLHAPGQVEHTNHGPTYLGELDRSKSSRLVDLRGDFDAAGLDPRLVDDINTFLWGKFVHNCGINAVCAATGLRPAEIGEVPEVDLFQTHIIEEALALARARGIDLPEPDPLKTIKEYCARKRHRVSMVQHLERGRPAEIDALNGYVARESAKLGMSAPYSDALAGIIKGIERARREDGPAK